MSSGSPLVRVAVWAALVAGLLFVAAGLQRTDDFGRLLPTEGALGAAADALLGNRKVDVLLIEIDGTGASPEALAGAVAGVEDAAHASGRFSSVRGRIEALSAGGAIRAVAVAHAVDLLPEDELREAVSEDGVRRALQGWFAKLMGPAGGIAARGMVDDPLDLGGKVLTRLRSSAGPWDVRAEDGLLLDASGTRALVLATSREGAFDSAEDATLPEAMDAIVAASPLPTRWFGGGRVATDMALNIQRDVNVVGVVSVVALIAVLAVGFRSLRPLAGLVPPLVVTIAAVGAVLALRSPIHGISLGFGGALLGIAVDYWVHLYVGAADRYAGPDRALRYAAALASWRHVALPMAVSAATTVAAFGVLLLSRFPVVRDLGWSGMAAIVGAFVGVWVAGPVAYAWTGGASTRAQLPLPPRAAGWFALGVSAALALAATAVRFDGDPAHLLAVSDETQALQDELAARYGGIGASGVVLVRTHGDLGAALDAAADAELALGQVPGVHVSGPSALVPGPARIAARRAALPPPEVLRERVTAAATGLGIDPASLMPGIDRYLAPTEPITTATWASTPLADVVGRAISDDAVRIDVTLSDPALAETMAARLPASATLVVPAALAAQGVVEIRDELVRLGGLSGILVFGLLVLRYREPRRVVAAALPVVTSVACVLGTMALLDWPLDAVSTSVLALILGLVVDYGIFLADGDGHATGVALAAATSIAGFAPMMLSRSQALAGAGLVVGVGLGAGLLVAVTVTPRIVDGTFLGERGRRWLRYGVVAGLVAAHVELLVLIRFVAPGPAVDVALPEGALPEGDDRRVPNGHLARDHGVWAMTLEGTYAELGVVHGQLAHDLRERLEGETFAAFGRAVPNPLARAAIIEGILVAGAGLDPHVDPRWRAELAGLVASTPDPRHWLLPGYTRKLYFHALHDIGQALVDSPLVACTGFLATGSATDDGHTLLARVFDFEGGETFDTEKFVIARRPRGPDAGFGSVSVAFPGMVGVVTGINERKIAVALQAAGSDAAPRMATPMTFVLRRVLEEAASLEDVGRILDEERGFGTEIVLAADGARGETAVFEVTPDAVARLDGGELLGVANHLRSPTFSADAENARRQVEQTTAHRLARVDELLAERRGSLDLRSAVEILRDRQGEGGTPLPRGHRWAIDADIASHAVAIDVTEGVLWVSVAPNLAGGFVAYRVDELLAGEIRSDAVVGPRGVDEALATHRGRALLREAKHARDPEPIARDALRHLPDHPEALLTLAEALADRGADAAEITDLLDRAEKGPPEDARDRARLSALRARVTP